MITLRDYQREAIAAVADGFRRGMRRVVIAIPTGTGKTVVFSDIARTAVAKDNRVLILAHRDELISQAVDKLTQVAPELAMSIGVVKAKRDEYGSAVTVASVQSLHPDRLKRTVERLPWPPWRIVIVDEAHHAVSDSYMQIMQGIGVLGPEGESLPDSPLVIGVTATPQRADSKDLGDLWQEIVYHRDMLSMMEAGYLCNLKGISIRLSKLDVSELHKRGGDFIAGESGEKMIEAEAPKHTVAAWRVHASDRKTLLFTPTVQVAEEMCAEFQKYGISAAWVSGNTPEGERRRVVELFEQGVIQVVCNCAVFTEGFDVPSIECVVIARPTASQPFYVQMVGRGTRNYPGKEDCLILDVVGATDRHDLTTLPKLFGLSEKKASNSADGITNVVGETAARKAKQIAEGLIVAKQVELFDRTALNWQLVRPGVWALSMKDETVILDAVDSKWAASVHSKAGGVVSLGAGVDLQLAMGLGEEHARKQMTGRGMSLIDRNAKWRNVPATDSQLNALKKWGRTPPQGVTKGEANDMLSQLIAIKQMRSAAR